MKAELSDEALIRAAREGDQASFTALVRRYENTVYGFSYKVCGSKEKAAENLQDTFISVFRKLDTFDGRSKFSTWLYSIVTNNCLMRHRRRKLDDIMESLDNPPVRGDGSLRQEVARWDHTPAELLLRKELRTRLEQAIQQLPVEYRIVFVLRDIEEKSTEETARIVGISVEATKSRLRRARAFLRKSLDPYVRSSAGEAA